MIKRASKLLPVAGIILLIGLTLLSTAVGATKIIGSFKESKQFSSYSQIPQVLGEREVKDNLTENKSAGAAKSKPAPTGIKQALKNIIQITISPTPAPNRQVATSRCIITLFGTQYDVIDLKRTHSGGDIFACGSDMTASYQSRHGTDLSRMERYKITGDTTSTTIFPTGPISKFSQAVPAQLKPTSAKLFSKEEEDDRYDIASEKKEEKNLDD